MFHFADGGGGDAFFATTEAVAGLGFAEGLFGEVAFAFETAVGETAEGVEHAKVVERVGDESLAQNVGSDVEHGLANLAGGDLLGGLQSVDLPGFCKQSGSAGAPGDALGNEALLAEMVLVSALFPAVEHIDVEIFTVIAQGGNDVFVNDAVVHHLVDAPADFFGEPGDIASATAARGERCGAVYR